MGQLELERASIMPHKPPSVVQPFVCWADFQAQAFFFPVQKGGELRWAYLIFRLKLGDIARNAVGPDVNLDLDDPRAG